MKGRKTHIYSITAVLLLAVTVLYGCGGNRARVYDQVDGEMARATELNPDSIPALPEAESYYIGYGDILDVIFLYENRYSREGMKVRPDGRITYPFVGEIFVAGMSPANLDSTITVKFSEIVIDPHITVIVREFTPQKIYLLGEVGNPGNFEYVRDMTLMQALALGNGYTRDARKSNVLVIRRVGENHIVGIEVDIDAILSKNDFSVDVPLQPYDIVYVPMSRIATTEQFIDRLWTIIGRPMELYLKGWQIANAEVLYQYYSRTVQ
ncbi:MAG: polysaccharide biosynthesis/export family protein [Candidatus Krumholzibacteria bacterium]|nr:polysaccharide biosynthesis/export family protein [Candidatus Krumholzibacteria bacterium]